MVLYAKTFEDLPIVHRIGDIIRVHRATIRLHKKQRQFNANVFYNSSWALFSSDKQSALQEIGGHEPKNEHSPFAFSGKHHTFEKSEVATLSNLKKWANQYFGSYNVITNDMFTPLNKVQGKHDDFDVLAKILQIFEMDEYTNELKVRDGSGQTWYVLALKLKFPHLRVGDVVRIRSATHNETSSQKKVLNLSHYSNIMTFISASKVAKEVKSKVHDEKQTEKDSLKKGVNLNAVVLTEVDKKHANLPTTSLYDLFHFSDNDPELSSKNTFKTTFYVTRIEPGDSKEFVKVYDKKTKKATSCKGSSAGKSSGNLIYQVQFLVKDVSTQFNTNHYRVLLYTHEGLGANFFNGLAADNLYKNADAAKKIEGYSDMLTKFNSWVEAVVERRNGFYFIKDTKIVF